MGAIYQLTFFLALALLAIVITVFVFAVSLLGRAMEAAARSERDKLTERRESNAKAMAAIKKEIEEAEAKGEIPKGLTRKLKKLEKRDEKFDRDLAKIRKAPELLTVKGGIVPSSASLLGALILTGAAWYLSNIQIFIWIIPVFIWILGFAAIVYSIFRIYRSLKVIESVAITSEGEAEKRLAQAVKVALVEVEEEKKPELELIFKDVQPPFHVEAESETVIKFSVGLRRGDIARNASVVFWAPPSFQFPGSVAQLPTVYEKYASYVSTKIELEDIIRPILTRRQVKLKAPSQPNSYIAVYRLLCEGFASGYEEFKVIVEES